MRTGRHRLICAAVGAVGLAGGSAVAQPANDACATATLVTTPGVVNVTSTAATTGAEGQATMCPTAASSINNDVWYRWVAPASGTVSAIVLNFPTFMSGGVRLALRDGGAAANCPGTAMACNGTTNFVSAPVVAGRTYYFQVGAVTAGQTGVFRIEFAFVASPTGRCCLAGGSCVVTSPTECAAQGGTYGTDGSVCSAPSGGAVMTYVGPGGTIPDFATATGPSTITRTLTVPDSFPIAGVELDLSINHSWLGDLIVTLSNGTRTVTLANRTGRGRAASISGVLTDLVAGSLYRFGDSGGGDWWLATAGMTTPGTLPAGTYRPTTLGGMVTPLSGTFNGAIAAGTWTLTISDNALNDTGALTGWTLRLTPGLAPACAAASTVCCRGSACELVMGACATAGVTSAGAASAMGGACNAAGNTASPCCKADYNKIGNVELLDIFAFLQDWFGGVVYADFDGQNGVDLLDIFAFLQTWFNGACP